MLVRLAYYIHLTFNYSKGQSQGHVHFDYEYIAMMTIAINSHNQAPISRQIFLDPTGTRGGAALVFSIIKGKNTCSNVF